MAQYEVAKPWKDARAAHATLRAVMQSRPLDSLALRKFLADLDIALTCLFGRESQELAKFGFKPARRAQPLTTEQKVIRAAKAKLTREKRHTMGSRQKAGLKETGTPSISIAAVPTTNATTNGTRVAV